MEIIKASLYITLLLITYENIVVGTIPGEGPHHHPQYKYSCNEDLTVTFKGVRGTVQIFGTPNKNCNVTSLDGKGHFGNFKLSKQCLTPANGSSFSSERSVQVSVYDKNENETIPSSMSSTTPAPRSATPPPSIIATGRHIFKLTCLPIPKKGVERVALAESGVKDVDELQKVYNEIDSVEMRFKEYEDANAPDISEVYIGDMFFMYLKYLGETDKYKILPASCTAFKGTYRSTDLDSSISLKIFNQSGNCVPKKARNLAIMENFLRDNDTMVHAKLHGFRFATKLGESGDITISCKVRVCTALSGGCRDHCTIPTASPRKRRESGREFTEKIVSESLKVNNLGDDRTNGSGKQGTSAGVAVLMVVAAMAIYLIKL